MRVLFQKQNLNSQERGFASIVIALVLIMVLSLMTVGFAQLARREQQTALNKQLAQQAFYAAETGINDVIKYLSTIQAAGRSADQCVNDLLPSSGNINTNSGVRYTCALVDFKPKVLRQDPVSEGATGSMVFSTDQPLDSFVVEWSSPERTGAQAVTAGFMPRTKWSAAKLPSVIEFHITPLDNLDRSALISKTFTAYFYPSPDGSGGTVAYDPAGNQAPVVAANCKGAANQLKLCSVSITGLGGTANRRFLMRLTPKYTSASLVIEKARVLNGTQDIAFLGAQVSVDVTGQARTVLKRLRVNVPLDANATYVGSVLNLPDYAIQGRDICKRLSTYPGSTDYVSVSSGSGNADSGDACNLTDASAPGFMLVCSAGEVVVNNKCVAKSSDSGSSALCAAGEVMVNNKCVAKTGDSGSSGSGSGSPAASCPAGFIMVNNKCIDKR
jgi:Tfp pilus assembly protein PilX